MRLPFAVATLFVLASPGAAAEQVYRCGPDGRTYQNKPCDQGRTVHLADPRSAEQQRSAQAAAKADARLADELERTRKAREAAPLKASGFNARPVPPELAASAPAKPKKKRQNAPAKG